MKHLVLGLGSIGRCHAKNLIDCGQEIVGVDVNPPDDLDFLIYDNLESGLEFKPDVIWISTPTHLHSKQVIAALKRGIHVFVEKPVASDLQSALMIEKVWESTGKKQLIWVGCNMRFHPGVIRIKEAIDNGLIGKPLAYRIHFSHYLPNMRPGKDYRSTYVAHSDQGGGIILDDIHDIDLALWFAGPIKKIIGVAANSGVLDMDVEDIAHISLLHENGIFSELHMDFLRKDKSRGIEVIGENGTLEWRSRWKNPEQATLNLFFSGTKEVKELWRDEITSFDEMFQQQCCAVLNAVDEPEQYTDHFSRAIDALEIAQKVREQYLCLQDECVNRGGAL